MVRTSQRAIPIALFVIAAVLLGGRIVHSFVKREPAKNDLVRWVTPQEGIRLASTTGKPLLLDFTAEWCAPCHLLDAEVFRNPAIARDINDRFIAVRVVDRKQEEGSNSPEVQSLQQRFGVRGFPTVVFTDATGQERGRMEGFRGREEFERVMESLR